MRCSYGQRNSDRSELSLQVLEQILDAVDELSIGSVIFSGGGEPLSWSAGKFEQVFRQNATYSQAIATNGLGLMKALNKELLQRLDIIQINVNGYDKNSYLAVTGSDQFVEFSKNLKWLFASRDKNITQITGKVVVDTSNYRQVKEYMNFCHQMGFDLIVIKLAGNFELGQNVALNQEQKKELRELIYSSPVIHFYPEQLDAIATEDNATELELPQKCWIIEHGLYALIRSNGDVFLCVASPYTAANSIGNVNYASFKEIWTGAEHREIKNKLHRDMRLGKCNLSVCRHMRYNFLLDEELRLSEYVETLPSTGENKPKFL
jgi:MoaA/NifB/PqqE/SkfB family radical SAM enzyme